jgi:hypothetical protein
MGFMCWTVVVFVVLMIVIELRKVRNDGQARVNLVNRMQAVPYSNLAFNVDKNCSICFETFKDDDEVFQLKCH